jgi:hypothetical protein
MTISLLEIKGKNVKITNNLFKWCSLLQAGNCTLREAVIISSILAKNSIPMLHSAAAILKIYYLRTIHAMFALNWLSGFRGEDF